VARSSEKAYAPAGVPLPFICFFTLPDLIRQSMRKRSSIGFADRFSKPHVSIDHRVKPGGGEVLLQKLGRGSRRGDDMPLERAS
jgi:hypothetical protein